MARITRIILISLALLASGCWADFPEHLLEPDQASPPDSRVDQRADANRDAGVDSRRDLRPDLLPDTAADRGQDQPADLAVDRGADIGPDAPQAPDQGLDARQDTQPTPDQVMDAKPDSAVAIKALGKKCSGGKECYSEFCVQGVCCDTACNGLCMACDLAQSKGRCAPVPAGQDPLNDCKTVDGQPTCKLDGTCDGRGKCRQWPAGTMCAKAKCGGKGKDKVSLAKTCDGLGKCVGHGDVSCGDYLCDAKKLACFASCKDAKQCSKGSCKTGKCNTQKKPPGSACIAGGECAAGFCVDGVCCATACSAKCETCKLTVTTAGVKTTLAGKCLPVPAGLDPDTDCTTSPAAACGEDGTCDGAGSCAKWPAGTRCEAQSCNAGSLQAPKICDAQAKCVAVSSATSCGDYSCLGTDACYGRCTANSHCAASKVCAVATQQCQ